MNFRKEVLNEDGQVRIRWCDKHEAEEQPVRWSSTGKKKNLARPRTRKASVTGTWWEERAGDQGSGRTGLGS